MSINISELIWSIINFLVLVVLLKIFLYKPMMNFMENRRRGIADSLEEAAAAREEAVKMNQQLAEEIDAARKEARAIVDQAKIAGEEAKEAIMQEAKKSAADMMEKAAAEIEWQKAEAVQEIKKQMAQMILLVTSRMLNERMSAAQSRALIDQYIEEVGEDRDQ